MKSFTQFKTLNEKLSKADPIEKWIHDFVHSDNPKFDGKSKEERIKMAQGAYYGAQNESVVSEETGEHHDYEHVKKTMKKVDFDTYAAHMRKNDADHSMENKHKVDTQHSGSYTGKIHGAEVSHKVSASGQKEYYIKEELEINESEITSMSHSDILKKIKSGSHEAVTDIKPGKHVELRNNKTGKTFHVYVNHDVHEEVEQIDELSKGTLASYVKKSAADASGNAGYIGAMKNSDSDTVDKAYDKLKKRHSGIATAAAKLAKEEVEQIDEISKETLKSYIPRAAADMSKKDREGNIKKGTVRLKNIIRATNKLAENISIDEATFMGVVKNKKTGVEFHAHAAEPAGKTGETTNKQVHLKDKSGKVVHKYLNRRDMEQHYDWTRLPSMHESADCKYVVKYNTASGEHKNTSKAFDTKQQAQAHADKGSSIDKSGGKYSVHAVNEEIETSSMTISFKEFIELDEGKIDDLKDKRAEKEDDEYLNKKSKDESPIKKVKGSRYGSDEEDSSSNQ